MLFGRGSRRTGQGDSSWPVRSDRFGLWAVVLACLTLVGNGGVWLVNRLAQMDAEGAQERIATASSFACWHRGVGMP